MIKPASIFLFALVFFGATSKFSSNFSTYNLKKAQKESFEQGVLYEYKLHDLNQAHHFYMKSCNLKLGLACLWDGLMHKEKTKDIERAVTALSMACNLKNEHGCRHLKSLQQEVHRVL